MTSPDEHDDDHFDFAANGTDHLTRRRLFRNLGAAGVAAAGLSFGSSALAAAIAEIPEETAGPYPGDGSNGPNVLNQSGIVRQDIRPSFGSLSETAAGVPTALIMTLLNANTGDPLVGAAVYVWHCTREGGYSLYTSGITNQNYLRGVQVTDSNGQVTFVTVFPACYSGRWPHIHFEVYPDANSLTASQKLATSQFALPQSTCEQVYSTATGYSASTTNLSRVSLATDGVFSDGYSTQLLEATAVTGGYILTGTAAIDATTSGTGGNSNAFAVVVVGKTLAATVPSNGAVKVKPHGKRAKKYLKSAVGTGAAPSIPVSLRLTKAGRTRLRRRGRLVVKADVTFTPTSGTATTVTQYLTLTK